LTTIITPIDLSLCTPTSQRARPHRPSLKIRTSNPALDAITTSHSFKSQATIIIPPFILKALKTARKMHIPHTPPQPMTPPSRSERLIALILHFLGLPPPLLTWTLPLTYVLFVADDRVLFRVARALIFAALVARVLGWRWEMRARRGREGREGTRDETESEKDEGSEEEEYNEERGR